MEQALSKESGLAKVSFDTERLVFSVPDFVGHSAARLISIRIIVLCTVYRDSVLLTGLSSDSPVGDRDHLSRNLIRHCAHCFEIVDMIFLMVKFVFVVLGDLTRKTVKVTVIIDCPSV
jgi:hypothetical protein